MPRGDGTGPSGQGVGRGMGRGRMGGGRGMGGGNRPGSGPGGNCVCPACGTRVPHRQGIPCNSLQCPKCKGIMIKE